MTPCVAQRAQDIRNALELGALVEEVIRARRHACAAVLRVGVIGEDDEDGVPCLLVDGAQHVDAGAADELVVEQDAGRMLVEDAGDRVGRRAGVADDVDVGNLAHELAQALPHRRDVVDDEDFGSLRCIHGAIVEAQGPRTYRVTLIGVIGGA